MVAPKAHHQHSSTLLSILPPHSYTSVCLTQLLSFLRKLHQYHALWSQKLLFWGRCYSVNWAGKLNVYVASSIMKRDGTTKCWGKAYIRVPLCYQLHFWGQLKLPLSLYVLSYNTYLSRPIHLVRAISKNEAANRSKTPENTNSMSGNSPPTLLLGNISCLSAKWYLLFFRQSLFSHTYCQN
jgi:hypothetical protein